MCRAVWGLFWFRADQLFGPWGKLHMLQEWLCSSGCHSRNVTDTLIFPEIHCNVENFWPIWSYGPAMGAMENFWGLAVTPPSPPAKLLLMLVEPRASAWVGGVEAVCMSQPGALRSFISNCLLPSFKTGNLRPEGKRGLFLSMMKFNL